MGNQWNGFESGQSLELALFVAVQLVFCFETVIFFCSIGIPGRARLWAHTIVIGCDILVIACSSFFEDEKIWEAALVASCALTTLLALYQHVSFFSITRRSR